MQGSDCFICSAMPRSVLFSASLRGLAAENVCTLSRSCSKLDMPLRITVGRPSVCSQRKAQLAHDSPGRSACSTAASSGSGFASLPPRTGSMTQMGM